MVLEKNKNNIYIYIYIYIYIIQFFFFPTLFLYIYMAHTNIYSNYPTDKNKVHNEVICHVMLTLHCPCKRKKQAKNKKDYDHSK
jgi:hypothetical protein